MADKTSIEWTDATWQIVTGCSVVSPGCTNCYAMRLAGTRLQHHHSRRDLTTKTKAGPVWNGKVRFNAGWATQPLQWKKPRDIFVAAHGDLFHDSVQRWMLVRVFVVMAIAQRHRFQVLTKRADNMRRFCLWLQTDEGRAELEAAARAIGHTFEFEGRSFLTLPLPNVWLGVSAEDQTRLDERAEHLSATPAAVRWISAEPLLGPIDAERHMHAIDWIVAGGESGPKARPSHPDWFRALRSRCVANVVPFFFKQWGEWAPIERTPDVHTKLTMPGQNRDLWAFPDGTRDGWRTGLVMRRVGKKAAGAMLDGLLHREFPR